jgi:KaiC/GvpD/RAD55 family RecA-like ATPase
MEKEEKKGLLLTAMFPKKIVLFSNPPLSASQSTIYRLAYNYITSSPDKKLIWVSSDQPADKVPAIFKEFGFNIDKYKDRILFVDIVTSGAGVKTLGKKEEGVHYIESPNNMVEITMTLADLFDDKAVGLAVIDSINGMLAFNGAEQVTRFLRFLPVIAVRTDTTILVNYVQGQYEKSMENALQVTADASLMADDGDLLIKTRTGMEKIANR